MVSLRLGNGDGGLGMNDSNAPVTDHPLDDGFVGTGRPLGSFPSPISDEDARRLEEAWNDMSFYNAASDDAGITAGYVPKPTLDPNRTLLPSLEEIWKLPRWARVAFAARSARRVLPTVRKLWTNAPKHHLQALDRAVRDAEHSAGTATDSDLSARDARDAAADAARGPGDIGDSAGAAAYVVADAATYADVAFGIVAAHATAARAVQTLCQVVTVGTISDLAALVRDFDRLCRLVEKEKWTDDTPVPPSVFGPMWEGTPPV
jgi:hypothetical protein